MERRPENPDDEEIVDLDADGVADDRDEVARALADAERAVSAVQERHKKQEESSGEHRMAPSIEKLTELVLQLEEERERAIKAEEESGRMREALLRKTADFENLKRRTEREKTDFFKFALAEVLRDLLGVLDNFERALAHGPDSGTPEDFRAGIEMIAKQLQSTLRKYGLTEIPAQGLPFDPNVHEAIVREETDSAAPGTVLEVLQKGYALNDRLLRPARVKVAGTPARSSE
jgi:molecular chaperone GrpE